MQHMRLPTRPFRNILLHSTWLMNWPLVKVARSRCLLSSVLLIITGRCGSFSSQWLQLKMIIQVFWSCRISVLPISKKNPSISSSICMYNRKNIAMTITQTSMKRRYSGGLGYTTMNRTTDLKVNKMTRMLIAAVWAVAMLMATMKAITVLTISLLTFVKMLHMIGLKVYQ